MKYRIYRYRHGDFLFKVLDEYKEQWAELTNALDSITDEMIIEEFEHEARKAKSISQAINRLIKKELVSREWKSESYIFADEEYGKAAKGTWRLDFAKGELSVEVAFNHRSDISWNLIKPTLASELNHVQKAIQTSGGIIVTATNRMKAAGGFDSACGTFEDYVQYLKPLGTMLPAPLVIVGLEPPESFSIEVQPTGIGGTKAGCVVMYACIPYEGGIFCPYCGVEITEETTSCPDCGRKIQQKKQ